MRLTAPSDGGFFVPAMKLRNEDGTCGCGSGLIPDKVHDGYGIFLTYACEKCEAEQMKKYRPDIMGRYEADEPIEPEDYEGPMIREDW